MIIQHNISALNAYRNFGRNQSDLDKSLRELSSGYKINRAADDAAGLAISESMRNKINGLDQAKNNAQDGISMIQIADGALTEVHAMLERGTTLATQAANDTYTDDVRKNIDAEFQELKKEIDRISETTEFNGVHMLKGLHAAGNIDSTASVLSDEEIEQAKKDVKNIVCNTGQSILNTFSSLRNGYPNTDVNITLKSLPGTTLANAGGTMSGGKGYIVVNADLQKIDSYSTATYESTLAHEMMHGVMGVALRNAGSGMAQLKEGDNQWFVEGTAQAVGGIFSAGWNLDVRSAANSASTDEARVASVKNALGNHGGPTSEVYGTGALMTAYIGYLASGSAASDGSIALGVTGNASKIATGINNILGEIINNGKTLEQAIYDTTGRTESDIMSDFSGRNSSDNLVNFLVNVSKEAGSTGCGSVVSGLNSSLSNNSYYNNYSGSTFNVLGVDASAFGNVNSSVTLQIGPSAEETIEIFKFDMSSEGLGLSDVDVLSRQGANDAMGKLQEAVNSTSLTRAYFGAKQNRLEHTLNNLEVSNENTVSAESRIRDTDMAKSISKHTKSNIMMQAAQSMLAQANQSPQGVLSLLG
ncbi:flagellinolysin [Oribacterium sp. WCC10]|uniref:flagellinolysin n=1 Tax=Oribacterium sp. WCC10 TaxID=1855343 RepID=UPI0008E7C9A8|nr:flagellinolysin [Oribacterium sp. WCC10]SFG30376.1 flagellin [Oribacterium sp. WCC10]